MQTNIHSIRTTQAHKPRPLDIENLSSDDFDMQLPFVQLLELWFPQGKWGFGDRSHVFYAGSFIANTAENEAWVDIATGDFGHGSIELAAYRFGIDQRDHAESRMRQWAEIASPVVYPDGDSVWNLPEPTQAN